MATITGNLAGGVTASAAYGLWLRVSPTGTWVAGDTWSMTLSFEGVDYVVGVGVATGIEPQFALTLHNRMFILAGSALYLTGIGSPTAMETQDATAGFVEMLNQNSAAEALTAAATYQGLLLVTSRRTVQTYVIDPDPAQFAQRQVLSNVGTFAPLTVHAVGEMDVYMLYDSGIRSIRVRDASSNAILADIGVPIDKLVQADLLALTEVEKVASCGVVEPSSNRYWCYIPGHSGAEGAIYVFSSFPSSEIAAWSTYRPTSNALGTALSNVEGPSGEVTNISGLTVGALYYWTKGIEAGTLTCGSVSLTASGSFIAGATTASISHAYTPTGPVAVGSVQPIVTTVFAPEKFVVLKGRVYVRATNGMVYLYGGSDNNTYDRCGVEADTPFLYAKTPATRKLFNGIDAACEGTWQIYLGTKPSAPTTLTKVYDGVGATFERGKSLATKGGTHFKLKLVESGDGPATFAMLILHYEGGDEK